MRQDWRGNAVNASDAATVAGIDAFVQGFLAYETGAGQGPAAADADPGCALANAYAAMLCLFLESPEGPPRAAPYLARAEAAAPRRHRARSAWWSPPCVPGRTTTFRARMAVGEEMAARFPRELAMAKATQYHYFNLGDAPGHAAHCGKYRCRRTPTCRTRTA